MRFFENKVFLVGDQERELISRILREGQRAYQGPLNVIHQKKLLRRKDAPFGAEQLIKLSLEALLIQFVRESSSVNKKNRLSYSMRDTADNQLIGEILDYLDQNLGENITITSLCAKFNLSPTYLKRLFREKVADSPIHHLILLRIAEAKRLIREEEQNFTQIAELTGFNSIHYFSRSFKAVTGMTPSEYAVSVKAMAQLE